MISKARITAILSMTLTSQRNLITLATETVERENEAAALLLNSTQPAVADPVMTSSNTEVVITDWSIGVVGEDLLNEINCMIQC